MFILSIPGYSRSEYSILPVGFTDIDPTDSTREVKLALVTKAGPAAYPMEPVFPENLGTYMH